MELLTHFDAYINAQKNVGTQFAFIGVVLLIVSAWAHSSGESPLASGLKTGALICGVLMIIGGIGYRNTETTLLKKHTELYHSNQAEFKQVETKRMAKVKKDYPIYQFVFGGFVILSLLLIWFVKKPYWNGIAFAIMIQMVGTLIVEAFSHRSIIQYYESLIS